MTASMSSRLRLLLDSVPLSRVDSAVLAAQEDQVLAWQLDIGSELGAENVPLAHVVLVVEGTLRVSGRDAHGQPFTLRRIHAGEWWGLWSGLSGVAAATCRTTETTKVLAVPINIWQGWWQQSPALATWLESHPQREDLYAALRPLLAERPRQDRTFLDEIDQLQAALRTAQLDDTEALKDLKNTDHGVSWLIPSLAQLLPDLENFGVEGVSVSTLERVLQRSDFGLRLVGYPTAALQELFESPASPSPLASDAAPIQGEEVEGDMLEALPEWQNPDGEALLASALRQEEGRPARDAGLQVTRFSAKRRRARSRLAVDDLRNASTPSVATSSIACSREWWATSQPQPREPGPDCRWPRAQCRDDAVAVGPSRPAFPAGSSRAP